MSSFSQQKLSRDVKHKHDRQIASATHKCDRARRGKVYKFELPPPLRKAQQ